jgi:hypothetical protein
METRFPASDVKARNEKQKIPYNRKIAIVPLSFISDACLKRAKPFIFVGPILQLKMLLETQIALVIMSLLVILILFLKLQQKCLRKCCSPTNMPMAA